MQSSQGKPRHAVIGWCTAIIVLCLTGIVLTACSSGGAPYLEPPDMIEQLANADLSERDAGSGDLRTEYSSGDDTQALREEYRGDDQQPRARRQVRGLSNSGDGYELNFNQAELSDLAKVILKDTLEIPYVIDPRVKGRVTVSTGGSVSRDELLTLFETVLEMHGAVLIDEGRFMRIGPSAKALQSGSGRVDYGEEHKRIGPGYGISILPLEHVSSETMLRMLRSFSTSDSGLRASVVNNLLIIRGSAQRRASLVEVARMFDVDWMVGQSAGIYTLRNSSPAEVIAELEQVFRLEGQGKGLVRFKQIRRLNAVLALTDKSSLLDEIDKWVSRLDREGVMGDSYFVYRVENAKAKELADLLNATFGGTDGGFREAEEDAVSPAEAATSVASSNDSRESNAERDSQSDTQNQGSIATGSIGLAPASSSSTSNNVRITPDEVNNRLLIRASGVIYQKILQVLHRIDRPPVQVLINATLAEVTLNDDLRYGVQFFLQKNGSGMPAFGFTNGPAIEIAPSLPGLNFIAGAGLANPRIILDAIAAETAVRIVSSPSVVVLHNQAATLQVGEDIPVATRSAVSVIDAQAPVVNEIDYRQTGVILKVTPRINSSGLVTMEVEQEISTVTSTTVAGELGGLTPTVAQRRITSTIAVQDGQMVVLGGLISEAVEKNKKRIPIVGKIPYLGDIVGDTQRKKVRRELIVFLRPQVIREARDASQVAQELRARMESLAPRRAPWDEDAAWKTQTRSFK